MSIVQNSELKKLNMKQRLQILVICGFTAFTSLGVVPSVQAESTNNNFQDSELSPLENNQSSVYNKKTSSETVAVQENPSVTQPSSVIPNTRPLRVSEANKLAQGASFPDVQGHWARTFIEGLAARNIISGYPDGSFRPDQSVTRAEFSAILRKAFRKEAVRGQMNFTDIPANFWGTAAIQEAYQTGFLSGYPDGSFRPDQRISRLESLVSLASGLKLSSSKDISLASFYDDADSIPNYATSQLAAATDNRLVVNYSNVKMLSPNQAATRADVAAFIYQSLVSQGTLAALPASESATAYIVGYQAPIAETPTTPSTPQPNEADLKEYILPEPPATKFVSAAGGGDKGVPGSSITSPSAFGSQWGDVFAALSYQERTRGGNTDDGAVAVGFGLGDARKYAGLEVAIASFSTFRQGFYENGGVSLKLHRLLTNDLSIAAGIENAASWGGIDGGTSGYGVISKYFQLQNSADKPFSSVTTSVGLGGGRFRNAPAVTNKKDNVNIFGSVGVRVVRPVSFIMDWSGQDLGLGLSIAPFRNIPLTINPSVVDLFNNSDDKFGGPRFTLGVGYGLKF
jgi:S-layer homology domain